MYVYINIHIHIFTRPYPQINHPTKCFRIQLSLVKLATSWVAGEFHLVPEVHLKEVITPYSIEAVQRKTNEFGGMIPCD